jgi:hypothetical protein
MSVLRVGSALRVVHNVHTSLRIGFNGHTPQRITHNGHTSLRVKTQLSYRYALGTMATRAQGYSHVYVDMVPLLPYKMQREDLNGGNLLPLPNSSALAHLCVVAMNEAVVAVVVVAVDGAGTG